MTLYADSQYYSNIFKGCVLIDFKEKYLKLAQEKINSITFNRIVKIGFDNLTEFQQEKVREAICYQAEYIYMNGYNNGNVSSYSVLDISVTVDKSNKTAADRLYLSEEAYDAIHQTGLDCRING